jgi:hypothetical protein
VIVDLVETGRTLRENGLHPVEEWLAIAPYLIGSRAAFFLQGAGFARWRAHEPGEISGLGGTP